MQNNVQEPGLDQHEWQTQWEQLEPELADAPAEALPELARLVDGMLEQRGYEDGVDPEIDRELELGREIVARLEQATTSTRATSAPPSTPIATSMRS
jgi:hypothetical protein